MASDAPPDNPLSATSLSKIIAASLPQAAEPQLQSPLDAITIAAHACMISVGFRLVGLGEDHRIETTSSDGSSIKELPAEWKTQHAFRYKHSQSSMEYLLKMNRMGSKIIILAMGLGDDRTNSIDVKVDDFVSPGNLPSSPGKFSEQEAYRTLGNVFISIGRLADFASLMRVKIIQRLMPGLSKEGYAETRDVDTEDAQSQAEESRRRGPRPDQPEYDPMRADRPRQPLMDPLVQPRRPMPDPMPGFEDEHEILRPPRGLGGFSGPRYGDQDLYPAGLGPRDPLRGGIGPGLSPMGGGMHPTFDDPLFAGQGQRPQGYNPQAPPGSRFDPIGPGAGHPRGAGLGGAPPNPFSRFGDGDFL